MAFEGIIGHGQVIKGLKGILEKGIAGGSYLFSGPKGVGKKTVAAEFARAINCQDSVVEGECHCASCNKAGKGTHPDIFMTTRGESASIKIEDVRGIIREAGLKPYEGRKRIFIIEDADFMTPQAQNAILKLLEEPSERHILILTASNLSAMLPTIISRCRILKFYPIDTSEIERFMVARGVAKNEAALISRLSMGSIGVALSFRERNIVAVRDEAVSAYFMKVGFPGEEDLSGKKKDYLEDLLYMLLCWYRDLLVANFSGDKDRVINIDRSDEILSYGGRFPREKIERSIKVIMDTIYYIVNRNVNPKTALFNMAVELKWG